MLTKLIEKGTVTSRNNYINNNMKHKLFNIQFEIHKKIVYLKFQAYNLLIRQINCIIKAVFIKYFHNKRKIRNAEFRSSCMLCSLCVSIHHVLHTVRNLLRVQAPRAIFLGSIYAKMSFLILSKFIRFVWMWLRWH